MLKIILSQGSDMNLHLKRQFAKTKKIFRERNTILFWNTCDPSIYTMEYSKFIVSNQKE